MLAKANTVLLACVIQSNTGMQYIRKNHHKIIPILEEPDHEFLYLVHHQSLLHIHSPPVGVVVFGAIRKS